MLEADLPGCLASGYRGPGGAAPWDAGGSGRAALLGVLGAQISVGVHRLIWLAPTGNGLFHYFIACTLIKRCVC